VDAGVKGLIDDVPVDKVTEFARELREYLKSNKPDFISKVMSEKQLGDETEAMLKDAIKEVTSTMLAAA
jgi:F-type H+-transporting ATPase subunit alpha